MPSTLKNIFQETEKVDGKSFQFLLSALEKNALEAFDYLKFKQSLLAMRKLNMEEPLAIQSAFATANTMGLTKELLLKTARHYKKILENEKVQFDEALEKQVADRIESRKAETQKLYSIIDQCKEQIQKLEAKIAECEARIASTDTDIKDAEHRILSSKEKFESTFNELIKVMDRDIELYEQVLS
jgi:chromosome segregation ATPase